ncbi:MAG: hypothetical protein WCL08_05510 [Verrucomicrobiota bacterium]
MWTVFLLLLAGVVFSCWLGSFYVVEHPENPRAYRLLKRLNKLPPPTRFELTKAPGGEFLEAQRVFERYSKFTAAQFGYENEMLFRNYLRNYSETKRLVPYLTGKYVILKTYELQKTDLFTSGVVILTQATAFPQMLAEIVCPTPAENVKELLSLLQPGLEVRLKRTLDLSAIVQVSHAVDGRLQVTVVPLLYGNYALKNGVGSFSLEPPISLNIAAGFPVVRGEEVRSVVRDVSRQRNLAGAPTNVGNGGDSGQVEVVRIDDIVVGGITAGGTASPVPAEEGKSVAVSPPVTVAVPEASSKAPGPVNLPIPAEKVVAETLPASVPRVQLVQESQGGRGAKSDAKNPPVNPPSNASSRPPVALSSPPEPSSRAVGGSVPRPNEAVAAAESVPATPTSTTDGAKATASAVAQAFLATKSQPPSAVAVVQQQVPVAKAGAGSPAPSNVPVSPSNASGKQLAKPVAASVPPTGAPSPAETRSSPPIGAAPPAVIPLKPFLAAAPAPSLTQPTGSWKTFGSSRQPSGKSVTPEQATALQGQNDSAPLYLHGKFVVTAAGANRAVLRQSGSADGRSSTRVIVEYPAGAIPPQQGAAIAREDGRGFEIREVRRSPDGQVNIYVREVLSQ